jgi:hypothetical protein
MIEPGQVDLDDTNLSADDELANRVLDGISQMHPQYMALLLQNGDLAKVVRQRIDSYKGTMARLAKALPNADYTTLDEMASDCLQNVNPNWEDEKRLTREEKKLLKAFRETHQL